MALFACRHNTGMWRTYGQTYDDRHDDSIYRASIASYGKNGWVVCVQLPTDSWPCIKITIAAVHALRQWSRQLNITWCFPNKWWIWLIKNGIKCLSQKLTMKLIDQYEFASAALQATEFFQFHGIVVCAFVKQKNVRLVRQNVQKTGDGTADTQTLQQRNTNC